MFERAHDYVTISLYVCLRGCTITWQSVCM